MIDTPTTPSPPPELCARCGRLAEGEAWIDGVRYCHGETSDRTCFEKAEWGLGFLHLAVMPSYRNICGQDGATAIHGTPTGYLADCPKCLAILAERTTTPP